MKTRPTAPLLARVLEKVAFGKDHWIFWGNRDVTGDGRIKDYATNVSVRRVLYEDCYGALPAGQRLGRTCTEKRCCKPAHAGPMTRSEISRNAL